MLILETYLLFCMSTRAKREIKLAINNSKCQKLLKNKEDAFMKIKREMPLYMM